MQKFEYYTTTEDRNAPVRDFTHARIAAWLVRIFCAALWVATALLIGWWL